MMHVLLISSKFEGEIELRFNECGVLEKFENRAKLEPAMLKWFFDYFPKTTDLLKWMIDNTKTLRMKEVPLDISFASFWERYDRKINKKRCEPLYAKLDESEKIKCVMAIKQYDFFLQLYNRVKMDPENWLRRSSWETEWNKVGK